MNSNVYLLMHRDQQRFKVGKANDIIGRARSLGLHEIDWARSAGFSVASSAVALRLERLVLVAFQDWRIPAEQVAGAGCVSGATEWLRSDCRERVEELLRHTADIIPQVRVGGAELQAQFEASVEPVIRAAAGRARSKDEESERDVHQAQRRLASAQASREILVASLAEARSKFWAELLRHVENGDIVGTCADNANWSLVLISEDVSEMVWRTDLHSTGFRWPRGCGSLVQSVAEWSEGAGRVSVVNLACGLDHAWPSQETSLALLGDVAAFLRSLVRVDAEHLKAAIWTDPWRENKDVERWKSAVVQQFIDLHLPVLQSRRAAEYTYQLFN